MRDPNRPVPRGVYILPNLFTTASLFTGFMSIIFAVSGRYDSAAWRHFIQRPPWTAWTARWPA